MHMFLHCTVDALFRDHRSFFLMQKYYLLHYVEAGTSTQ
jgi:hypothetical protein